MGPGLSNGNRIQGILSVTIPISPPIIISSSAHTALVLVRDSGGPWAIPTMMLHRSAILIERPAKRPDRSSRDTAQVLRLKTHVRLAMIAC